jgi:hypothetical protein
MKIIKLNVVQCIVLVNDIHGVQRDTYKNNVIQRELIQLISPTSEDLEKGKYVEHPDGSASCDVDYLKEINLTDIQIGYLTDKLKMFSENGTLHRCLTKLYEELV